MNRFNAQDSTDSSFNRRRPLNSAVFKGVESCMKQAVRLARPGTWGKRVTDCWRGSRALGTVHFSANRSSTVSVRARRSTSIFEYWNTTGSSWRYDEEKRFRGHSFLHAKRGAWNAEPTFFSSLSIHLKRGRGSEKNPASKIDRLRHRSTSGKCWAAANRSPAADNVLELQVFVIFAKDGGDSESNAFSRREESSLIHRATMCTLSSLIPDSQSGAERQWTTLSQRVWQDTDESHPPELLNFGHFTFRSFGTSLGKHPWCSRFLTRPAAD